MPEDHRSWDGLRTAALLASVSVCAKIRPDDLNYSRDVSGQESRCAAGLIVAALAMLRASRSRQLDQPSSEGDDDRLELRAHPELRGGRLEKPADDLHRLAESVGELGDREAGCGSRESLALARR
jgi:hypothetical protein